MPSPLHYIPFAHRDWLSSSRVRRMPFAAQGAYVALLCYQWEDGSLPAEPDDIGRAIGMHAKEMAKVWPYLEPAFPVGEDGQRRNPRMAQDREEANRKVEKNRANGSLGGRPRGTQPKPDAPPPGSETKTQTKPRNNRTVPSGLTQTEPIPETETKADITDPSGLTNAAAIVPAGPSVFDLAKGALEFANSALGAPAPRDEEVRKWLKDSRGLVPLAREFGPAKAGALYVFSYRTPGCPTSWSVLYDQRYAVLDRMQREAGRTPGASRSGRQSLEDQIREASAVAY